MIRKILCLALIFTALLSLPVYADGDVSAHAAIVVDMDSGETVYEKNADERMLIASTTKIMTALVVLENCGLDEAVTVTAEHAATEGSSMYLVPGENYTVEQLLYGMMLASGNDAAAALAEHVAGSMEAFAALMNDRANSLGLENTHFENAHGLDAPEHYSCARDMAVITIAAMENEKFCEIFSTKSYTVGDNTYYNHNKLLTMCPGCVGGKTGYTEKAGRVLVSCCVRDSMRFACVTISDPDDWDDHMALYDRVFSEYRRVSILGENTQLPVISGSSDSVQICAEPGEITAPRSEYVILRTYLPDFVYAPVNSGEKVGYVRVSFGEETREYPVFAKVSVERIQDELSTFEKIKRFLSRGFGIYYFENDS